MTIISTYISSHLKDFGLSKDIELTIQSTSSSKAEGVKHVYVQQMHSGLPIVNSIVRFTLKNNQVFSSTGKFTDEIYFYLIAIGFVTHPFTAQKCCYFVKR